MAPPKVAMRAIQAARRSRAVVVVKRKGAAGEGAPEGGAARPLPALVLEGPMDRGPGGGGGGMPRPEFPRPRQFPAGWRRGRLPGSLRPRTSRGRRTLPAGPMDRAVPVGNRYGDRPRQQCTPAVLPNRGGMPTASTSGTPLSR